MPQSSDDWPNAPAELVGDSALSVSKSEIKRDAQALKELGKQLVAMGKNALTHIPLDEQLRTEIELAQRLTREGQRRQLQLIGKLLRQRDIAPITQALDKLNNRHNQQTAQLHKLEALRDELITQGDSAITEVMTRYPMCNRQQLRQLVRCAQRERTQACVTSEHARKLLRYLRQLTDL